MIVMLLDTALHILRAANIKSSSRIFQDIHPERMRRVIQTPRVGFEPTTDRLTADCSTIELPRKKGFRQIYTTGVGFEPTTDRLIPARRDSTIELPRKKGFRQNLWAEPESNRRHKDFQSFALPAELSARRAKQFTIPCLKLQVYRSL